MGNCLQSPEVTVKSKNEMKKQTKPTNGSPAAAKPMTKRPPRKQNLHENIAVSENPMDLNIFDYYEKIKHIAQGSTCDIWTIRHKKSGNIYALKIIPKTDASQVFVNELRNEIDVLKTVDHPNAVRVYEMFEDHKFIYMVSEYCGGGDLYSQPLPYDEPQAALVLTKILSAVTYLHKNHIVHRDLKPQNVMYENEGGEPKLIDFGLSKRNVTDGKNMKCLVGTVETMSPQVFKGEYNAKADVWSIGVIAYVLLSGNLPFDGATDKEIAHKIVKGEYSMEGEDWAKVSQSAKDFCKSLLTYDPDKRPTAAEALKDPWLRKNAPLSARRPGQEAMTKVQNALVHSAQDSKLKKVAAMMIAYKSSNESLKELRDAFDAVDANNHGTITFWEFRAVLRDCNFTDDELKVIFKDIDVNGTGVINYTEFLAATLETQGRIEDDLIAETFNRLDMDKSGYLSKEELCSILGSTCTAEDCDTMVNEILDEVDTDKDGTLWRVTLAGECWCWAEAHHISFPFLAGRISYDEFMVLFREKRQEAVSHQCCPLKEASRTNMKC